MHCRSIALFAAGLSTALVGCQQAEPPAYAPNLVYRFVVEKMADHELGPAGDDINQIVTNQFGTPVAQNVPNAFDGIIDHAKFATGKVAYDKYCAACHGTNGDGRGPAAALLNPYPRDYRPGVFKFKSTLPGEKPLHSDIVDIVERGVPGTAMKPIPEMSSADREAVAHYVVFLASRGELERSLLTTAAFDFVLDEGERYFPPSPLPEDYPGMEREDADELIEDLTLDVADSWTDNESYLDTVEVPTFLTDASQGDARREAAERGKEHFASKEAACKTCHRFDETGKAIPSDKKLYDRWSEEWTTRIQLDPENESSLVPVIARGALPPREAIPRRLGHEPLRGGDDPRAVFAKIKFGIEGTPMPKTQIADNEVLWDLVAYVLAESAKVPADPSMIPPATATPDTATALAN